MTAPLRILLVEDNPDDELIVARELRKGGLAVTTTRVESRPAFLAALAAGGWDLIISDYNLPGFGGMEALALLHRGGHPVPFILVSGTVGEEVAVQSIKAGADDYLLKQNLLRLVPAVRRVLQDERNRRERAASEVARRESQQRLELIFHTVSDFLVFLTAAADGRWTYTSTNRAFARILDRVGFTFDPKTLVGMDADEAAERVYGLAPDDCQWLREQRAEAVRTGRPVRAERTIALPGGAFVAEFTLIPILDADGICRHLLCDGRDVTDLRRAEEHERKVRDQMVQAQKLESLGTLAGGIAHDFNNLLTGILGFAELAQTAADLPTARQYTEDIIHAAGRAKELVGRILTFSRQKPAASRAVPLAEVVREMLPLMRASFPKSIHIADELPAAGPFVRADAGQLHQTVLNLCTNAAHAMPGGGRLRVAVESVELGVPVPPDLRDLAPGRHAKLTVSDTGTGMSADTLRRLFEPFFTTKPPGLGTGLGLAIVHGIVRDHGGAVRVSSDLGHGSAFEVYLPETAAEPVAEVKATPHPVGRGERILCVDDEPTLADMVARMLTGLGYKPTAFTDPVKALAAFAAAPDVYQAVVTDNRMPTWCGLELIRRLTAARPGLPAVLMTGVLTPEDHAALDTLPRAVGLGKPFGKDQLARAVHQALTAAG